MFGIVDISTRPATGYMQLVAQRNAATLLPIIQQHVHPGTVVHSDEWAAYSRISAAGYTHSSVSHSLHFVDPITGTHTQHIESYWSRAKAKLKRMHGTCDDHLPEYLDEFMWRERFGRTAKEAYDSMIGHITERYPLP